MESRTQLLQRKRLLEILAKLAQRAQLRQKTRIDALVKQQKQICRTLAQLTHTISAPSPAAVGKQTAAAMSLDLALTRDCQRQANLQQARALLSRYQQLNCATKHELACWQKQTSRRDYANQMRSAINRKTISAREVSEQSEQEELYVRQHLD